MAAKEIMQDNLQTKLDKAFAHIKQEYGGLRTGRASQQLLDPVSVEAYGARMKITELASVSVPDHSLIVIQPWDKGLLDAIVKGIEAAGLNLHPVVDGQIVRISVPALTAERRQEMVKLLHQKAEQGRVLLRNIRAEEKQQIEKTADTDGVSEDDIKLALEDLEKTFKDASNQLDNLTADKEKELTTI